MPPLSSPARTPIAPIRIDAARLKHLALDCGADDVGLAQEPGPIQIGISQVPRGTNPSWGFLVGINRPGFTRAKCGGEMSLAALLHLSVEHHAVDVTNGTYFLVRRFAIRLLISARGWISQP
jgi:hypothetical protein